MGAEAAQPAPQVKIRCKLWPASPKLSLAIGQDQRVSCPFRHFRGEWTPQPSKDIRLSTPETSAERDPSVLERLRILFAASRGFWLVNQINFGDGIAYFGFLALMTLFMERDVGLSTNVATTAISFFSGFAGLWQLQGTGQHTFLIDAGLAGGGDANNPFFELSFNVADIALVVGVAMLVLHWLFVERPAEKRAAS